MLSSHDLNANLIPGCLQGDHIAVVCFAITIAPVLGTGLPHLRASLALNPEVALQSSSLKANDQVQTAIHDELLTCPD